MDSCRGLRRPRVVTRWSHSQEFGLEGRRRVLCGKGYHSGSYFYHFLFWDFLKRFSQDTGHFDNGVVSRVLEGQRALEDFGKSKAVAPSILEICMVLKPLRGRVHLCLTRCLVRCISSTSRVPGSRKEGPFEVFLQVVESFKDFFPQVSISVFEFSGGTKAWSTSIP